MLVYCRFCGAANTSNETLVCRRCGRSFDGRKASKNRIQKEILYEENDNSSKSEYHLQNGVVLNGIYRIEDLLGEGGFGITYMAIDEQTKKLVAIKELYCKEMVRRNVYDSKNVIITYDANIDVFEKTKRRFIKEAKTLIQFSSEKGIVRILDYFEENNTAYLVMNYLDGVTLKEYICESGVLQWKNAFAILRPIMESLSKIHSKGLVHRDISSSNIMVLQNGDLVLLDFGSSKMLLQQESYTNTSIFAKKGYTPIEQYSEDGEIGEWTDVYALTAVLYECITGTTPPDSLQRVIYDEYQPLSKKGVNVPDGIEEICARGLAVRSSDRFQNVSELLEALDSLLTKKAGKKYGLIAFTLVLFICAAIFVCLMVNGLIQF